VELPEDVYFEIQEECRQAGIEFSVPRFRFIALDFLWKRWASTR